MNPQIGLQGMEQMLQQMQRFAEVLEEEQRRIDTDTFSATDEAKTVEVTLSGRFWLTDLYIQSGLMRLGATTVSERLNEALRNAQDAVTEATSADQERFAAALVDIVDDLQKGLEPG